MYFEGLSVKQLQLLVTPQLRYLYYGNILAGGGLTFAAVSILIVILARFVFVHSGHSSPASNAAYMCVLIALPGELVLLLRALLYSTLLTQYIIWPLLIAGLAQASSAFSLLVSNEPIFFQGS